MTIVVPKKKTDEENRLFSQIAGRAKAAAGAEEIPGAENMLGNAVNKAKNQMAEAVRGAKDTVYGDNAKGKEDGLSQMIREAQNQTDALGQPKENWVDKSYTTWNPTTDVVRNDKYVSDKAGQLYTDRGGQKWMHTWDDSMTLIDGKTEEEIEALREQQLNRDYNLTVRVYKVNPD